MLPLIPLDTTKHKINYCSAKFPLQDLDFLLMQYVNVHKEIFFKSKNNASIN